MKNSVKQFAAGTFLALVLMFGFENVYGTEFKAGSEIIETSLQLENWMTDRTIWNTNPVYVADFVLETETEAAMELESWMTGDNMWNINKQFIAEAERALELEAWMTSNEMWNVQERATEQELTLETWMTDNKIWQ